MIKKIAQAYVNMLFKFGLIKFSFLLTVPLMCLILIIQAILALILHEHIRTIDIIYSVLIAIFVSPMTVYFMSIVVDQLEDSRKNLADLVVELNEMRDNDQQLNLKLKRNIRKLSQEILERIKVEESLAKAMQDKTTFIATISHELRTPLNGIVGLSRMLLETQLNSEQSKYVQTINMSALILGHIFNDLIDLDKFDRHKIELNIEEIDFFGFLEEIKTLASVITRQKNLSFRFESLTTLPAAVAIDATRVRQILWNLISNAVKFTKQGHVIISVSAEIVDSLASIIIEVEDTGIGIAQDEFQNIFEMYYQAQTTDDQGKKLSTLGTGIGLSVAKKLSNLMNGDISLRSKLGLGSVFCLSLQVPVVDMIKSNNEKVKANIPALNIFLVEDIELNIIVAKSLLESLGHTVTTVMTGQEAIEQFVAHKYDLVLLDIQLPDMTGFEIAAYYRHHYNSLPPLIALTANVFKQDEYLLGGMDGVLTKPLLAEDLQLIIEQFCCMGTRYDERLNIEMLTSYIEIVSIAAMKDMIALFSDKMPEYINDLNTFIKKDDRENIALQAHLIKGACASIGLVYLQDLANKLQSPHLPNWCENIDNWAQLLKENYIQDIKLLKRWLTQQENN